MTETSVLVVGAGAGGHAVAQALTRRGFPGSVTIVGAETHQPYDRPPLSKAVLTGAWGLERTTLPPVDSATGVRMVLGRTVSRLDVPAGQAHLGDGETIEFETLVIATGLSAVVPHSWRDVPGVHVLRTADDAVTLAERLRSRPRTIVAGGGFLGLEIAASARSLGCQVSVVEAQPRLLAGRMCPEVGERLEDLHRRNGVALRLGTTIEQLRVDGGRLVGADLSDGTHERCELVIAAVGGTPNTGWIDPDQLTLDDGVVCDAQCRAAANVFAVGDVARAWNTRLGRRVRIEHRMVVAEHASVVADTVMGVDSAFDGLPFFWSDQFDVKLQSYGDASVPGAFTVLEEDRASGAFVGTVGTDAGPTSLVGWNTPRSFNRHRRELNRSFAAETTEVDHERLSPWHASR